MLILSKSEQFVMSADISFPSNNPNAPLPRIKIYLPSMLTFPNKKCVLPDLYFSSDHSVYEKYLD